MLARSAVRHSSRAKRATLVRRLARVVRIQENVQDAAHVGVKPGAWGGVPYMYGGPSTSAGGFGGGGGGDDLR